jgi:DNA replication protein DnaC
MKETLDQQLAALKVGRIRQVSPHWLEQAVQSQLGHGECLEQLLTEELLARQENQLRRKLKAAGFPYLATIDPFDCSRRPELKRAVLIRFFDRSFITKACSLVLIGPSGLGKTHLAVALGTKMVQWGYRVRFVGAHQLANAVVAAATRAERAGLIGSLITCELLILDEFGYLPLNPQIGPVLDELIAGRYEQGATVMTSNKSLASWGEVVGDSALMMASIDRLLHHGEVFYLRGSSSRLRGKEAVALTASKSGEPAASTSSRA